MGLGKGRSTIDGIFIIQHITEKHKEYNRKSHLSFVDYEKALDNVNRNKLCETIEHHFTLSTTSNKTNIKSVYGHKHY